MILQTLDHALANSSQHGNSRNEHGTDPYPSLETISNQSPTGKQPVQRIATPLEESGNPGFHPAGGPPPVTERCCSRTRKPANTSQWVKTQEGRETAVLHAGEQAYSVVETPIQRP